MTFVLRRLLWALVSLLGISLVTFGLMDLAPADRARLALEGTESAASAQARQETLRNLRVRFGQIDPVTGEEYGFAHRYLHWLAHAATLDFAGASEDPAEFAARIKTALPVTLLLALLSILGAVGFAVPVGTWLGLRRAHASAHVVDAGLVVLWAVPQFLLGTLLVLALAGGFGPAWLPATGLRSPMAETWSLGRQIADFAAHLVLPVITLAVGPAVLLTCQLRESVARAADSDFVRALRGFGMEEATIRRRIVRQGLVPLATATGTFFPMLVSGSVVVERIFALPGLGDLSCRAVLAREVPMVMAMTTLAGVATLLGIVASDLAHRALDPRIELRA